MFELAPTRLPRSVPPPSPTTNCVAATFSSGACCCYTERRLSHSALHQKPDRNNFAVDPHRNWTTTELLQLHDLSLLLYHEFDAGSDAVAPVYATLVMSSVQQNSSKKGNCPLAVVGLVGWFWS
ncbi:hypothetical protein NL676_023603 [Syzygium grande]|nr:hypothetical protein NL676_023603 [Syzygium grande]